MNTTDNNRTHDLTEIQRIKRIHSEQLFGDSRELVILHGNQQYTLRITRQDKLILTK